MRTFSLAILAGILLLVGTILLRQIVPAWIYIPLIFPLMSVLALDPAADFQRHGRSVFLCTLIGGLAAEGTSAAPSGFVLAVYSFLAMLLLLIRQRLLAQLQYSMLILLIFGSLLLERMLLVSIVRISPLSSESIRIIINAFPGHVLLPSILGVGVALLWIAILRMKRVRSFFSPLLPYDF